MLDLTRTIYVIMSLELSHVNMIGLPVVMQLKTLTTSSQNLSGRWLLLFQNLPGYRLALIQNLLVTSSSIWKDRAPWSPPSSVTDYWQTLCRLNADNLNCCDFMIAMTVSYTEAENMKPLWLLAFNSFYILFYNVLRALEGAYKCSV